MSDEITQLRHCEMDIQDELKKNEKPVKTVEGKFSFPKRNRLLSQLREIHAQMASLVLSPTAGE